MRETRNRVSFWSCASTGKDRFTSPGTGTGAQQPVTCLYVLMPEILLFSLLLLVGCTGAGTPAPPVSQQPKTEAAADVIGGNKVLDATGFADQRVRDAYIAAKKYARVLEEMYCYCRCRENIGHRALVECFETEHASHCDVCMNEAVIAARMTEEGKTPTEIQKAIDAYYAG